MAYNGATSSVDAKNGKLKFVSIEKRLDDGCRELRKKFFFFFFF